MWKRVLASLGLAFGFLGMAACILGIYATWRVGSRIGQANERVFALIDKGLSSAQDRLRGLQKCIEESKTTSAAIGQKLRDWSTGQAKERLLSQLEIESRGEMLTSHLQTADLWLETSTESIRGVQQILELGILVGVPADPSALEEPIEKLTLVRTRLQSAAGMVVEIRKFTATSEGESEQHRLARITKLLGRALLTMSEIDTRLEQSATRLSELQVDAQQLQARTSYSLWLGTVGCYIVLVWIAAGQAALCLYGWNQRPPNSPFWRR